jgi:hypothetical protein
MALVVLGMAPVVLAMAPVVLALPPVVFGMAPVVSGTAPAPEEDRGRPLHFERCDPFFQGSHLSCEGLIFVGQRPSFTHYTR